MSLPLANSMNSRELLRKLHQDRSELLLRQPFTAGLAMRLDIEVVNGNEAGAAQDIRIKTAATDGNRIYFDADFASELDDRTRQFVLCHEVWHCVMGHLRRQLGRQHQRWNRAIDYEVNGICRELLGFVPDIALYNKAWQGNSAEEIYALLENDPRGETREQGEVLDQHLPVDPLTAQQWREYLRQALSREQHSGSLPGHLHLRLRSMVTPALPWQHILQRFVQRQLSGERQWFPPSRRHIHRGLYLPRQRSEYLELTVAIDTSGSCANDLGKFLAQLQFLLGSYRDYQVTLLQCDTRITKVQQFSPGKPLTPEEFAFKGFGGTRFQPVFDYVRDHPTNALVYFTDGYAEEPVNHSKVPLLWVLTNNSVERMRSGEVVRMQ
ncbi:DUF2201 family putative metallopeptidase [Pseudidiomarina terrestris]|uniref:vWA domain-containing protein n=1 Tax=Pseudidiomarina terrestris TaxID=2820060 RepID=UPI002656BF35|nr:VWA-like domain-containing protein [Pseudidiomarina sp. 1ASP75-5]MDN7135372.1 hypothetical protein [Pseudidiomarina sp. 1ASP75-5]